MGVSNTIGFLEWLRQNGEQEFDYTDPKHAFAKKAYAAGFDKGVDECKNYDPKWDSD